MMKAQFNAFCPFEIGDKVRDTAGRVHEITDIAAIHYVRTGKVEFRYELDHSGTFVYIARADSKPRGESPYHKAMIMHIADESSALPPEFREFIARRFG